MSRASGSATAPLLGLLRRRATTAGRRSRSYLLGDHKAEFVEESEANAKEVARKKAAIDSYMSNAAATREERAAAEVTRLKGDRAAVDQALLNAPTAVGKAASAAHAAGGPAPGGAGRSSVMGVITKPQSRDGGALMQTFGGAAAHEVAATKAPTSRVALRHRAAALEFASDGRQPAKVGGGGGWWRAASVERGALARFESLVRCRSPARSSFSPRRLGLASRPTRRRAARLRSSAPPAPLVRLALRSS